MRKTLGGTDTDVPGPSGLSTVGSCSAHGTDVRKERIAAVPGEQTIMHSSSTKTEQFILGLRGVRYQVKDVQRSIAFYTQRLGFNLDMQNLPAFGQVSIGDLKLILSGPGASGSRPMPDGRPQEPAARNSTALH